VQPHASNRFVLAGFALLAVSSLGLKAAAGPPRDGLMDVSGARLDRELASRLKAKNFTVIASQFSHRSSMILGVRGSCRVAARDAREGAAHEILFSRDAKSVGPVRYFYRGRSYGDPPTFAMRFGRLETEAMGRLGMSPREPVPVAFAATPSCGLDDFGLADVRV
jgi:hypothetical protein